MLPSNIYILFVFLFTSVVTGYEQFRFDYTYDPKLVGWLKLHVMPATFYDAFMMCNAEGAVLASPLNDYLKKAMVSLHKKIIGEYSAFYTGIHSMVSKGAFASIEGTPISKIDLEWASYEPDNINDKENCIVMLRNGTAADVPCNETYPYICYKKKTARMTFTNECGTVDEEYTLDTRTGSCYKLHRVGYTWKRANMICQAEGGHLAIVNSNTEVQVLKDLMAKYPPEVISSPAQHFSIGFHDWGENGVWFTVHGQPLSESGYSTFAKGQPDNATTYDSSGSHCGGIYRTGLLDDLWCTGRNIPFICEKSPDSLIATDFKYK